MVFCLWLCLFGWFLICALERYQSDFYSCLRIYYGEGFAAGLWPCWRPVPGEASPSRAGAAPTVPLQTTPSGCRRGRCPNARDIGLWSGPGTRKQLTATRREPFSLGSLEGAGVLL